MGSMRGLGGLEGLANTLPLGLLVRWDEILLSSLCVMSATTTVVGQP